MTERDVRLMLMVAAAREQVRVARWGGDRCEPYPGAVVVEMSDEVLYPDAIGVLSQNTWALWPLSGRTEPGQPYLTLQRGQFARVPSLRAVRDAAEKDLVVQRVGWGGANSLTIQLVVLGKDGGLLGFIMDAGMYRLGDTRHVALNAFAA